MLPLCIALASLTPQGSPIPIAPVQTGANSAFGYALDVSGDSAVVGAFRHGTALEHNGFAQFYERDPVTGSWSAAEGFEGPAFRRLGLSVALEGEVAVIGDLSSDEQSVLVVEKVAGAWTEAAQLDYPGLSVSGSSVSGSAEFGTSVTVSGETLVIGASQALDGASGISGAAYVFQKVQGQWAYVQRLLPPTNAAAQIPLATRFGAKVSLDGDTLAVSGPRAAVGGVAGSGRVHMYERVNGAFVLQQVIPKPALPGSFLFGGYGFGLSGDTLAVGSIGANVAGVESAGVVHVFERNGGQWTEAVQLVDPAPSLRAYFGDSLALDGENLVVGRASYFRRTVGLERLGLVPFRRSSSTGAWERQLEISDPLEAGNTCFGIGAAIDGDRLFAGANCARVGGELVGVVYDIDLSQAVEPIATVACGGGPCGCAPWEPWLGCGNSEKDFAELSAFGSASLTKDDLELSMVDGVPNVLARLVLGPAMATPTPLGDGTLCIERPFMLAPRMTEPSGKLVIPQGIAARASSQLGAAGVFLPGETWLFQVLYDEPKALFPCRTHQPFGGPSGLLSGRPYLVARGFNLTGALAVTWRP